MAFSWLQASLDMIFTSAPWLLAGFLGAGMIHVLLPKTFIKSHLEKPGLKSVLKASIFGIPLPLCSCSVIPVGVSLRRNGASRGATASFFVSTPEIGFDSFLISYVLLGPFLAITRIVAVLLSAVGTGLAIDTFSHQPKLAIPYGKIAGCCTHNSTASYPKEVGILNFRLKPWIAKIKEVFQFAYIKLIDDLAVVLTIGFMSAGLISVLIPDNVFQTIGLGPFLMMLVMLIAALPVYVCATSSTPLIAALLAKGLNPGAALVFLLAGPATNISTMLVIGKELGKKALVLYLGGIISGAILCGGFIDFIVQYSQRFTPILLHQDIHSHDHAFNFWGLILLALLLTSLLKKAKKMACK